MHFSFGAENGLTASAHECLIGDALQLCNEPNGRLPALIAQDAHNGFVCQDAVANLSLSEPALISDVSQELMAVRSGLVHDDWNFREGQIGSQSCHGYNLWVQGVRELNGGLATGC